MEASSGAMFAVPTCVLKLGIAIVLLQDQGKYLQPAICCLARTLLTAERGCEDITRDVIHPM
jgi:hypothetical protein